MAADGFIHMDTEMIEPVMHGLAGAGDDLDVGWKDSRAKVESGEAGIGGDVLGQAFRAGYEQARTVLRSRADGLPPALRTVAGHGMASLADYADADVRAAGGFKNGNL